MTQSNRVLGALEILSSTCNTVQTYLFCSDAVRTSPGLWNSQNQQHLYTNQAEEFSHNLLGVPSQSEWTACDNHSRRPFPYNIPGSCCFRRLNRIGSCLLGGSHFYSFQDIYKRNFRIRLQFQRVRVKLLEFSATAVEVYGYVFLQLVNVFPSIISTPAIGCQDCYEYVTSFCDPWLGYI